MWVLQQLGYDWVQAPFKPVIGWGSLKVAKWLGSGDLMICSKQAEGRIKSNTKNIKTTCFWFCSTLILERCAEERAEYLEKERQAGVEGSQNVNKEFNKYLEWVAKTQNFVFIIHIQTQYSIYFLQPVFFVSPSSHQTTMKKQRPAAAGSWWVLRPRRVEIERPLLRRPWLQRLNVDDRELTLGDI